MAAPCLSCSLSSRNSSLFSYYLQSIVILSIVYLLCSSSLVREILSAFLSSLCLLSMTPSFDPASLRLLTFSLKSLIWSYRLAFAFWSYLLFASLASLTIFRLSFMPSILTYNYSILIYDSTFSLSSVSSALVRLLTSWVSLSFSARRKSFFLVMLKV